MTHSRSREFDRAVRRYMAEHPGTRYTVARRAVEERARTAPSSLADFSGSATEPSTASQEALARLLSGRRGVISGKTTLAFDLAFRTHKALVVDLDSLGSATAPQEFIPIIIDPPPLSDLPCPGGPVWDEALEALRALGLVDEEHDQGRSQQ
ncbi:hypothetical protein [Nonomuraea sp. NPDC049400]|uniref:hypothetical protein n=1 Tax=Nonomuraea sp. NPDC049400 TaxID=3364352 RepID=UPI0037B919D1